ncbi:MAG: ABC transporter ATP-binding protein [Planctomycetes bacterium]|nr:ABC transporter ATP-binding protein [Planctomycetota bacterium]
MTALTHDDDLQGRAYDAALMRRFLAYVRPYRAAVAGGILLTAVLIGTELVTPLLVREALDGPVARHDVGGLLFFALLFAGAVVLQGFFRYAENWVTSWVGQRIVLDLRQEVFAHLQRLSVSFFDKNPVGRLVTRVTNDVETLKELFTSGLVAAISDAFLLGAIICILFWIDVRLAFATLSMAPPLLVVGLLFKKSARQAYRDSRKAIARLNSYLQENLSGVRVVQAFRREERNVEQFREINDEHLAASLRTVHAYSVFFPAVEFLGAAATGFLLWYGGRRILGGSLSFGVFLAFWFYAQKFIQPIRDLSEKVNILQSAMAAAERLFKLLDTAPEVRDAADAVPAPVLAGAVEFKNVWFAYREGEWVLKDVSFSVRPGESIALVGATGAGKTTISNLLFRFYDVQKGSILVDGVDIRRLQGASYRRNLGLVLQDVFLFSGDVASNLRLGNVRLSDEELRRAAAQVHADEVIARLPGGLAAEVKERGASLSVGERQLLSFARALVFQPRILVLDEATSSIDARTEAQVQDALRLLLKGRTSIVIAHRLATIREVDRILVFHHGTLVEEGTHAELLGRRGVYARLYELQFERAGATDGGGAATAIPIPNADTPRLQLQAPNPTEDARAVAVGQVEPPPHAK